ncbi:redoxin domain-containing protein [Alteromonas sp. 345S023]|uniref:Redoxin domain-containing protein n=1 Tax=Alteromonas profundi TaxID=2696062 RepID=A0A7X5LP71_9ALTE|nr:TlpA disulfide reductase family protein [Alteromonas profundi]NDV92908.1 redoxin domain-containing protein [Alteromonas profundi]
MKKTLKVAGFIALMLLSSAAGIWVYQSKQSDFITTDGTKYKWTSLEGNWVIINYFAPWCVPCLREMPELHSFNQNLPSNTYLFAINYDNLSKKELAKMLQKHNITLPVIQANKDTQLPMEKPPYLPATFIIGPDGEIKDTIMGEVSGAMLRARIQTLQTL